jgi:hypothetical protein
MSFGRSFLMKFFTITGVSDMSYNLALLQCIRFYTRFCFLKHHTNIDNRYLKGHLAKDLEIEFEDDEEEEEEIEIEERPRRYRSEGIFGISKDDVIIILIFLAFGIFIGHWYTKSTRKETVQQNPFPFPFPMYSHSAPVAHEEREREKERTPGITTTQEKMKKRRGGYYVDKEGNAVMESPAHYETWTIRRDTEGNILDAYKNPGQEWIK